MAENETLDLGDIRSGRWRKLRDSIRTGKSATDIADEGARCLTQMFKNLQKEFEEKNGIPLKQVFMAATGEDGSFDEIMRQARFGRDYLEFFAQQCSQDFDERTIVDNVLTLTIDRFMEQIGQDVIGGERFPDAKSFREFGLAVKGAMIDDMQALGKQLTESPDARVKNAEPHDYPERATSS